MWGPEYALARTRSQEKKTTPRGNIVNVGINDCVQDTETMKLNGVPPPPLDNPRLAPCAYCLGQDG